MLLKINKHILNPDTDFAFCGKKQSQLYVNKPEMDLKVYNNVICKKCFIKALKYYIMKNTAGGL